MKKAYMYTRAVDTVLITILIALPILTFYIILSTQGPSWDMTARYLGGKTFLNFIASGGTVKNAFAGEHLNNLVYYFEPYREPLSTPIFAAIDALSQNSILVYMIVTFLAYAAIVLKLGDELGMDRTVALAAMVSFYSVFFFFVPNGGEGLAVIFVLLGILYLLRKSPVAGLFLGIAVLGKYPALILLPMVLLLWNRKKILYAAVLALIPVVLWGLINWALYGVPFYSYFASMSYSNVTTALSYVSLGALLEVVAYPAVFAGVGIAYILILRKRIKLSFGYSGKVIVAFIVLSFIGYVAILPHNDSFTQARYGFLFAASLMLASALIMDRAVQKYRSLRYLAAALAIAVLLGYAIYSLYVYNTAQLRYYNPGSNNSVYAHAGDVLQGLGFGSCRFVSNAWIPMLYAGYDAYSPFILYPDMEQLGYPIIIFNYVGVPVNQTAGLAAELNGSRQAYKDSNITVYLPNGARCYNYTEQ